VPLPDLSRTDVPTPAAPSFDDFGLPRKVVAALVLEDIETPTPVQSAVIPDAMAGHDVLGRARTGSGKTLAFGIPVVARLAGSKSRIHRPRALVIVPTRELAGQVERSLELVARALRLKVTTVYGGTRYDRQVQELRQGTDIVVATPGRLRDLIDRGALRTDDVEVTVLDEADHLCDLGFYPEVDELLALTPAGGQRMLLSATLDGDVDKLVRTHLRDPRVHEVDPSAGAVTTMEHHVLVVGGFGDKVAAVTRLVDANPRSIVFTRTREGATDLRAALAAAGVSAVDLHGNLTQRVRERNLERFADGRAQVVVATDVAARGIHVDGVGLVVHFDPPADPKAYLHRSGRTARAGASGAVVTIVTPRQVGTVTQLQRTAGVTARHHDLRDLGEDRDAWTAEALGRSGTTAPTRRSSGAARGGSGKGGRGPGAAGHRGSGRRGKWHKPSRETDRGSTDRSGSPDQRRSRDPEGRHAVRTSASRKPRWSKRDRDIPA
jgi:superfamily II DNA/RNA helicase